MKILFFHQRYDPEPEVKGGIFVRKLIDKGCEIKVITPIPYFKNGNLYPGYSRYKLLQRDKRDGALIYRVPVFYSHTTSRFSRALYYLSIAINTFLVGIFLCKRVDCVYVCGPPVSVGLSGFIVSKIFRKKIVYDLQDLWPESIPSAGISLHPILNYLLNYWCLFFYKKISHIVVQSNGIKDILASKGLDKKNITVVYNWCNEKLAPQTCHSEAEFNIDNIYKKNKLNIIFAGNIGKAQGLDVLIEVANSIQIQNIQAHIVLIGNGVEVSRLKNMVYSLGIKTMSFVDEVPIDEINAYLSRADFLLIHLRKSFLFSKTIPSKTQAYLASGKPILICVEGDAKEIVLKSGGGIYAEPESAKSIINAINKILLMSQKELNNMGENGRNFYYKNMSIDIGVDNFIRVFKSLKGQ